MVASEDEPPPQAYRVDIPEDMDEIPMFSFGANMSADSLKSRGVETGLKESRRAILRDYDLVFDMEPQGLFFKEGYYANVTPCPYSEEDQKIVRVLMDFPPGFEERITQSGMTRFHDSIEMLPKIDRKTRARETSDRNSYGITGGLTVKVHGVVFWITRAGLAHLDGFESPRYERRWATVELYDGGDEIGVMIYQQQPGERNEGKPGRRYIKTLIDGAEKAELSDKWISKLRSIPFIDFMKFDIAAEGRIEQLNRKTFKKEEVRKNEADLVSLFQLGNTSYSNDDLFEIPHHRESESTMLISLLGVVLAVPNNLTTLERKLFALGGDLTHTCARFVSYDASPVEGSLSEEQRGFLETVLESAVSQTKRLRIVGKLEGDFEKRVVFEVVMRYNSEIDRLIDYAPSVTLLSRTRPTTVTRARISKDTPETIPEFSDASLVTNNKAAVELQVTEDDSIR